MELTKEEKLFQEIVNEAWGNAEFKAELVENPVTAIEKLTGEKLDIPEGVKLVVRDQTSEDTVYVNIPAMPDVDAELNEEELEKVAGGCQEGRHSGQQPTIVIGRPINPIEEIYKIFNR